MNNTCPSAPANKKEYLTDLGKILVKDYGKKKFYTPEEVKKAHRKSSWYFDGLDFSCWGMSAFTSHSDFDTYHQLTGEVCDYALMKTEMLQGLSISDTTNLLDISAVDIDASWLDFGDVFENIIDGIGDFIVGIFDGIS